MSPVCLCLTFRTTPLLPHPRTPICSRSSMATLKPVSAKTGAFPWRSLRLSCVPTLLLFPLVPTDPLEIWWLRARSKDASIIPPRLFSRLMVSPPRLIVRSPSVKVPLSEREKAFLCCCGTVRGFGFCFDSRFDPDMVGLAWLGTVFTAPGGDEFSLRRRANDPGRFWKYLTEMSAFNGFQRAHFFSPLIPIADFSHASALTWL